MLKSEAIKLLGGTVTSAASAIGVFPQAVSGWPDVLPPRIEDRVLAALYRQQLAEAEQSPKRRKTDKPASDRAKA